MRGRGDAGAGHAREALAVWLKMRDGGCGWAIVWLQLLTALTCR
jgi:hypothetical protein